MFCKNIVKKISKGPGDILFLIDIFILILFLSNNCFVRAMSRFLRNKPLTLPPINNYITKLAFEKGFALVLSDG